jgi:TolB protein
MAPPPSHRLQKRIPLRRPRLRPRTAGWVLAVVVAIALAPPVAEAQWTNRYPRVQGYGHHVYLEGYELPTLSTGVMDPAPSPDGRRVAFTSRGWIWVLDLASGAARRVTQGEGMDFRPAWSPDGSRLALVRDSGSETWIVVVEVDSGREVATLQSPAIDLDPVFSPDGLALFYSSAREGTLDLWRMELATGIEERLTRERGIQLRPQPHPDGTHLLYLSKAGGRDQVRLRNLVAGTEQVLLETSIASQARPALSPDGRMVAVNWPAAEGWELHLVDVANPTLPVFLTRGEGLPLAPAWSADGGWIYFSHSTPDGSMALFRIRTVGGSVEEIPVRVWEWGEPTGRLRIRTVVGGDPAPARLNVLDAGGHPALPDVGQPRFDGQNGAVFFYSPGVVELEVPAGDVTVSAVQGLATPLARSTVRVAGGGVTDLVVTLEPLWEVRSGGWLSGEHHFHLNYGGPFQLVPGDLALQMAGEALDAATPLVANLHNRFGEQEFWGWSRLGGPPLLAFGQEVRSHFLGHVALVGTQDLFWPWIWGPGYQLYGQDDRPNAEPLRFARSQGGMATYVHPVSGRDPFAEGNQGMIPVGFIPDAVLGDLDALEVVCLWTDDLGTAELWYRILNLGIPLAANAGSDVMTDFYRTMAIGTTRVFVRTGEAVSWPAYLQALREGRSFVTTGPYLDFQVLAPGGEWRGPGDAVPSGRVRWRADLRSPTAVDRLELVVNGEVVRVEEGLASPGARVYEGELDLPPGGWVAARAHGGATSWPVMGGYPFAHASPVWIGERGSIHPASAARSATELLQALDLAENRVRIGYQGVEIPRLLGRYTEARERLRAVVALGSPQ